jgi:hypothetical protein
MAAFAFGHFTKIEKKDLKKIVDMPDVEIIYDLPNIYAVHRPLNNEETFPNECIDLIVENLAVLITDF